MTVSISFGGSGNSAPGGNSPNNAPGSNCMDSATRGDGVNNAPCVTMVLTMHLVVQLCWQCSQWHNGVDNNPSHGVTVLTALTAPPVDGVNGPPCGNGVNNSPCGSGINHLPCGTMALTTLPVAWWHWWHSLWQWCWGPYLWQWWQGRSCCKGSKGATVATVARAFCWKGGEGITDVNEEEFW